MLIAFVSLTQKVMHYFIPSNFTKQFNLHLLCLKFITGYEIDKEFHLKCDRKVKERNGSTNRRKQKIFSEHWISLEETINLLLNSLQIKARSS